MRDLWKKVFGVKKKNQSKYGTPTEAKKIMGYNQSASWGDEAGRVIHAKIFPYV